jgi:hypothetical protein
MTWVLLEAGLALALAIFIVWWTMPHSKKKDDTLGKSDSGSDRIDGR